MKKAYQRNNEPRYQGTPPPRYPLLAPVGPVRLHKPFHDETNEIFASQRLFLTYKISHLMKNIKNTSRFLLGKTLPGGAPGKASAHAPAATLPHVNQHPPIRAATALCVHWKGRWLWGVGRRLSIRPAPQATTHWARTSTTHPHTHPPWPP